MLSKVNLTTLRGLLAARAVELERLMQADPGRAEPGPGDVTDRKDLAERFAGAEVDDAEAARMAEELRRIAAARERLRAGTYGVCVDCEAEIDLRRLMLEPATSRCVECAQYHERGRLERPD